MFWKYLKSAGYLFRVFSNVWTYQFGILCCDPRNSPCCHDYIGILNLPPQSAIYKIITNENSFSILRIDLTDMTDSEFSVFYYLSILYKIKKKTEDQEYRRFHLSSFCVCCSCLILMWNVRISFSILKMLSILMYL